MGSLASAGGNASKGDMLAGSLLGRTMVAGTLVRGESVLGGTWYRYCPASSDPL